MDTSHTSYSRAPQSILFAPKTVYNPTTKTYVLFFNYIVGTFSNSFYGIATSATPTGPFQLQNGNLTLRYSDNGDENVLVDDDGQASWRACMMIIMFAMLRG